MLKGISPLLNPELLKILAEMGHGLDAILQLLPLDQFVDAPVTVMAPAPGMLEGDPPIWAKIEEITEKYQPGTKREAIDRFAFYDRTKKAYACVATGEQALYACIILKKGCVMP